MIRENVVNIEKKLQEIYTDISVPESKYEDAKRSYDAVGEWLAGENSKLKKYNPKIYAQGSFAFGTAIKPQSGCEYDVDLVCLLEGTCDDFSQEELKNLIGERLKENGTYSKLLDPKDGGRRCWTLKYADSSKFHMDILPAIPVSLNNYNELKYLAGSINQAICITDKEHKDYKIISNDWLKSNPQGYITWFKNEMRQKMMKNQRTLLAANESVDDFPLYKRKTVLQKAISLLKHHRDINWGNDDDKPISIIITTLATKAYNGEDNLFDALKNICANMHKYIEIKNGVYFVENPTIKEENFADKWQETPRKAQVFFSWLKSLNNLFEELLKEGVNISETLETAYKINKIKYQDRVIIAPKKKIEMSDPIKPWRNNEVF